MFLTKLFRRLRSDERGSALAAVVAIMIVCLALSTVITTTLIGGLAYTSQTRAGVQSQAAADAGTAVALAGLKAGTCAANSGLYQSATGATPAYRATIWRPNGTGGWVKGCPLAATDQVQIISGGNAVSVGLKNASSGNNSYVWSVFNPPVSTTAIAAVGPAIYAYSATGFSGSGTLVSVGGSTPDVLVRTGDVSCSGASSGGVDWVVNGGALTVSGSCNIAGNVWASGRVSASGGTTIGGNAVGAGITLSGSSKINGSAWSSSDITISGGGSQIGGTATGSSLDISGSGKIVGNTWIYNNAAINNSTISGSLTAKTKTGSGATIGGTTTLIPAGPGASPYVAATAPTVPTWVDFTYKKSDWTGFTEKVLGTACDYTTLQNAVAGFAGAPGIIDARTCTSPVSVSSYQQLNLPNDLVIVAKQFDLGGSGGFTASAAERLWLIEEDLTPDKLPTCASGYYFNLGGGFTFSRPNISLMIYTPCDVNISSSTQFNGQIFGGQVSVSGGATVGYTAVGLPNYDLSTGNTTTSSSSATSTYDTVSVRNMSNNGE